MTDSIFSYAEKDAFKKSYIVDYMRRYPMWDMLNKKGRISPRAGDRINQPYATNRPTGYSYGRDSTVQATQKGEIVQAWFDWGALAMDTKEYGWDIDRQGAQGSIETGTLAKLFATRIELLKDAFYYEHNDRLWNGDALAYGGGSAKSFLGIEQQITTTPSSGSHGGLSRCTYDELQNQQISGTSGPTMTVYLNGNPRDEREEDFIFAKHRITITPFHQTVIRTAQRTKNFFLNVHRS
jgi:hypothetical protein